MSIVTAIARDEFAIISADTRMTFHKPIDGKTFDDNCSKLNYAKLGWIGGAGFSEFIYSFQNSIRASMQNKQIKTTVDIENIFNLIYSNFKSVYPQQILDNSKVVYSFVNLDNDGFLDMCVESISPVLGSEIIEEKNILISFCPIISEEMDLIERKYKNLIEKSKSMEETIFNTACYIEETANLTNTVGKICDLGIMIKKSNRLIEQTRIRENVDVIKQAYKNGTLLDYMKVC